MKLELEIEKHNIFGGILHSSDFCTDSIPPNGMSWADRIASDLRFDEQCRKNIVNRKNNRKDDKNA